MSDVPGIYASNTALLDFGIVRKSDHRKKLPLEIMNSGKSARAVEINWIRQVPVKGKNCHFFAERFGPNPKKIKTLEKF